LVPIDPLLADHGFLSFHAAREAEEYKQETVSTPRSEAEKPSPRLRLNIDFSRLPSRTGALQSSHPAQQVRTMEKVFNDLKADEYVTLFATAHPQDH
jgi:hypothetical protein